MSLSFSLQLLIGLGTNVLAEEEQGKALRACQKRAEACSQALLHGDYPKFIQCTLPAIVKGMGGASAMTKVLRKGKDEMQSQGFEFLSVTIESPKEIIRAREYSFAVLPQSVTLKAPGGKLLSRSFCWVVGDDDNNGLVTHWDGMVWATPRVFTNSANLFSIWGSGAKDVWVVGTTRPPTSYSKGLVQHWTAGFAADPIVYENPEMTPVGDFAAFRAVWGSGPNDVWFAGDAGIAMALHWNGSGFSAPYPAGIAASFAIWGVAR